jgi:uncharacterized protein YbaP (TraB family)
VGHAPFWRVEAFGAESYLLGTLHDGVDYGELPAGVAEALTRARVLVTEADVRHIPAGEFHDAIALPVGVSLRDELSAEDWRAVVTAFAGVFPPADLDNTQPWFLHGLLVSRLAPEVDAVDTTLVARAEAQGVPLGFLETWQEQVEALNDLGLGDGLYTLLQVTRDREGAQRLLADWIRAYRQADLDRLVELGFAASELAARPRYYADIVFGRTLAWLVPLEEELRRGNAFIAVGFMHTLTEHGLVELWRARGFAVTRVD